MPDKTPAFYWDSSVWLSYLNSTNGRAAHIDPYVVACQKSKQKKSKPNFSIVASTFVIAEVAFVRTESTSRVLSDVEEQKIDALLSIAKLMSAHDAIMREARSMMREALSQGLHIPSGADAVHLATARRMNATQLHTYDRKLLALRDAFGFPIKEPTTDQPALFVE